MTTQDRVARITAELVRLDVKVEKLPNGVTRLVNRHSYLLTADIRNLTESDIRTFEGRG